MKYYLRFYYKYYYIILTSIFLVLCLNIYLISYFEKDETFVQSKSPTIITNQATYYAAKNIMNLFNRLDKFYDIPMNNSSILKEFNLLLNNLKLKINGHIDLFAATVKVINENGLLPLHGTPYLGSTISLLKTSKILKTSNALKGTQLKLLLMVKNNQDILFKPKWYIESEVIKGKVYAGKDRYNGEIVAFYISLIFGFPRVPISAKRIIDTTEIHNTANLGLKKTLYINSTTNETCIFGTCYYCKRQDPICTKSGRLEGAAIFYLPSHLKLKQHLHPWRRTYNENKTARWEKDSDYCDYIKINYDIQRILDFVDIAIFDFIILNGDRHLYEVVENLNNSIILIDNGKSFGDPYNDHLDILAPLFQCCIIRQKTWDRLISVKGGTFTKILQSLLNIHEEISLITVAHYDGLERRLKIIYATVLMCKNKSNISIFK